MEGRTKELGQRVRLSRERLAASELASTVRAWRLWAVCIDYTASYTRASYQTFVVTLGREAGVKPQVASGLLRRFDELGVFCWKAAPRGSKLASELGLPELSPTQSGAVKKDDEPSPTQSGTVSEAPHLPRVGPLRSNNVLSSESHSHDYVGDPEWVGEETESSEAPEPLKPGEFAGTPEWQAAGERPPRPFADLSDDELLRLSWKKKDEPETLASIRAEWERRQESSDAAHPPVTPELASREDEAVMPEITSPRLRALYGLDNPHGFHGDERTSDGIGDDERSQMEWRAANPNKARARRRREGEA